MDGLRHHPLLLAEEEIIFAAMQLLRQRVDRYGIPENLFTDKENVYVIDEKTREKAADSGEEVSRNSHARADSSGLRSSRHIQPKTKGRVERGSFQFGKGGLGLAEPKATRDSEDISK